LIRAFVAVPVDPRLAPALAAALHSVQRALPAGAVNWVRPENLHLTLHFLGEVPAAWLETVREQLGAACAGTPPLTAHVAGLGCFPNPARARVLWLGVHEPSGRLAALQERLAAALVSFGRAEEPARFHPHLTLGRVKDLPPAQRRELAARLPTLRVERVGDWLMDRVALVRSELRPDGPRYTELAAIPLAVT
jgi:2'-5' RNA ligase